MDPALLTFQEFWEAVNPGDKYHSSGAYNWSLSEMKKKREQYPTILFRRTISGVPFEFRLFKEDRYKEKNFVKMKDGWPIRDPSGEVQYYTIDELKQQNFKRYNYDFAVFDGEQQVAVTQDEWGCLLVVVAKEYRQFGLGPILTKLAWEAEPGKSTGGCTPGGAKVVQKVHQDFVREYLRNGTYSKLIKNGDIKIERVQEILNSAKLKSQFVSPKVKENINFSMNDPKDFLLFEEYGSFVLYDRKIKELLEQGDEERDFFWMERCIKGHSFAGGGYHYDDKLFLHQLGGDTPQIKKFMFRLAMSYAKTHGMQIKIFDDDLHMVNPSEVELDDGNWAMLKGAPINWNPAKTQEIQFRRTFDQYGEFKGRIIEMAEAKYRGFGEGTTAGRVSAGSQALGSWLRFHSNNRRLSQKNRRNLVGSGV